MGEALARKVSRLALDFDDYPGPVELMNALDEVVFEILEIHCVGYMIVPWNWRNAIKDPMSYYTPHSSVPEEWVADWADVTKGVTDLGIAHALTQPCPTTDTELLQQLNPAGVERTSIEVKYKYGVRDRLIMQVMSNRILFGYWSKKRMVLDTCDRAFLHLGAHLVGCKHWKTYGIDHADGCRLTNRELACLRLASIGMEQGEIAESLGLATSTCKGYLESARRKFGKKTTAGAVAAALRKKLIS